jgi:hypothetical protein
VSWDFTLSYDAADLPMEKGHAISFEAPEVPELAAPGSALPIRMRATTVSAALGTAAKVKFKLGPTKGGSPDLASLDLAGEVGEFKFTELAGELAIPATAAPGNYAWSALAATGETIASGILEVVPAAEIDSRRIARAIQEVKDDAATKQKDLDTKLARANGSLERALKGLNFALGTDDAGRWPTEPPRGVSISYQPNAVEVLGRWHERELPRIEIVDPAPPAKIELNLDSALALLGADRPLLRDFAYDEKAKELVCLIVDPARKRAEVIRVGAAKIISRFGKASEMPGEKDGTLGLLARALGLDPQGGVWVATDVWGSTSQFRLNQDGQPFEEIAPGRKGAIKHFNNKGAFVDAIPLLDVPLALSPGYAAKRHLLLASYRNVSAYHGAQVREGIVLIDTAGGKKAGEIKVPGGGLAAASSHLWIADIAGRVTNYAVGGRLDFAIDGARSAAPLELKPNLEEAMPVLLAEGPDGGCWLVDRKERRLARLDVHGKQLESISLKDDLGDIVALKPAATGVLLVGTKGTFAYPK